MGIAIAHDIFAFSILVTCLILVGGRRERTDLHWLLLGAIASLAFWVIGDLVRWWFPEGEWSGPALRVMLLGIYTYPVFWLLLAARCAGVTNSKPVKRAFHSAVVAPSILAFFLLLTNDAHHWLLVSESNTGSREMVAWAGPLLWFYIGWAAICGVIAAGLFLAHSRELARQGHPIRSVGTVTLAIFPYFVGSLFFIGVTPDNVDFTPGAACLCLLLLVTTTLHDQLSASLPIAMRDVIDNLREGVILANERDEIVAGNPAAARVAGERIPVRSKVTLKELITSICGDSSESGGDQFPDKFFEKSDSVSAEVRTSEGRVIEVYLAPVCRPGGEPVGRYAVLRDRTQERRYENFLVQSQKLESIGILAAGLAHEVNNPLAYVRANLAFLQTLSETVSKHADAFEGEDAESLNEMGQIVEETKDGIERISKTVNGLRRFSRISSEKLTDFDLNKVAEDAVKLAELHRNRGVKVIQSLAKDLPLLRGSEERMEQ
ncbi:MAG: hypothetical protein JRC77_06360, partial [Deltaproteobacteria bacterium]|nr:hypothetical protein [Deltaproteobacteria bacterium]